ncbi:DoxX family protein [Mucilaginibacter pedocola]|uniref:DoxX family protein n=1 Tax=Mucilaginibacter pedocola TaxID=1792845 RepID=A0A1S9PK17_9SPHI|nr:DoxX family protein [Mucilaginibacter pedocola]OOQ61303.1 DoxX family protein [Mucilaginibacter pedocola]
MNERNGNIALLILRIGIGSMFILHGWPKLQGGPDGWHRLGQNMQYLGINFLPTFWGFMAMVAEFFGGMLLIAGIAVRPAAALMFITMLVAALSNLGKGYGLEGIVEITELGSALLALLIAGGGRYTPADVVNQHIKGPRL